MQAADNHTASLRLETVQVLVRLGRLLRLEKKNFELSFVFEPNNEGASKDVDKRESE
jgi:hypothetical protein